jgi:hypothetical protein
MMHGAEKSDPAIVAGKPANKAEQPAAERSAAEPEAAEPVERRAGAPQAARARQAGDLRLPGLHLHLWQDPSREIPDQTENPRGPHAGEAQGDQAGDATAHAPADPRTGEMVGQSCPRLLQLPRSADQRSCTGVFRHHVTDLWRRTLRRRGQKHRMTWTRMTQLVDAWLPKPMILHPWPSDRFAVTHPRWEPYAGKPPVRFCAVGAQ